MSNVSRGGGGEGGACTVRYNTLWVMVTFFVYQNVRGKCKFGASFSDQFKQGHIEISTPVTFMISDL